MFSIKRSPLSPKELEARRANARKSTGPAYAGREGAGFNRLLHGGRSASLEAFLRQHGTDPHAFCALRKSIRPLGERVDPLQAALVKIWLKSPIQGGSTVGGWGARALVDSGRERTRHRTVGSLLSTNEDGICDEGSVPGIRRGSDGHLGGPVVLKRRSLNVKSEYVAKNQ
jgi:hypothetical protein